MCENCGCGKPDHYSVYPLHEQHDHEHAHGEMRHTHPHPHDSDHEIVHDHDHLHDHPYSLTHSGAKLIPVGEDILSKNNLLAERNRGWFEGRNVLCLNMVSSPGSGKTTILEKTIKALIPESAIFVIEGDQQTSRDAERIGASGAPVVQVNTGTGCHLDAVMIREALQRMEVGPGSVLFIENVGNLVCPALFDLGEKKRVMVISVTEGDDKPLKYPYMFQSAHLCLINKSDLLPYVEFSVDIVKEYALKINPKLEFIEMSATTGKGMEEWFSWIKREKQYLS